MEEIQTVEFVIFAVVLTLGSYRAWIKGQEKGQIDAINYLIDEGILEVVDKE